MNRRTFLQAAPLLAASLAQAQTQRARTSGNAIEIDPTPRFDFSPHFYMQFMEPIGATDDSMESAWSYDTDNWRKDLVDVTKDLAPDVMRFGGLLSRYYKWREGIGTPDKRPLYRNYVWGGKENHRVGTEEFIDFCKRVGSEPLYCVNFEGDGWQIYANTREGNRTGDAREAADWVEHTKGRVKLWQLGNETSYGRGGFSKDQSITKTIEFAKAMRERDKTIQLIGWGDDGWAADLSDRAGEHLNYVAAHMMQQSPMRKDTVLHGNDYQYAPERAWDELMEMVNARVEKKLLALETSLDARNSKIPIAITEGHLSLQPHNSSPVLTEWLTGVYHARVMNLYHRHGARVRMCTAADFNGMRWTSNAVLHPGAACYLLPVGSVMRLFKHHNGKQGVDVKSAPGALDVTASRTGEKLFLHVANKDYNRSVSATFAIKDMAVTGGKVFVIASENPRQEISARNPNVFTPKEHLLTVEEAVRWSFPARSVSAVELECKAA